VNHIQIGLAITLELTVLVLVSIMAQLDCRDVRAKQQWTAGEALPARFWIRAAAWHTDSPIIMLFVIILVSLASLLEVWRIFDGHVWLMVMLVLPLLFLSYFTLPIALGRQTWGKHLAGLGIQRENGRKYPWPLMIWRSLLLLIFLIFYLIFIDILVRIFNPRKRTLHDLLADSNVRQVAPPVRLLGMMPLLFGAVSFGLLFGILRPFVVSSYFVQSSSLAPTLTINDHFIVNKLSYRFALPHRGDIIVFSPTKAGMVPGDSAGAAAIFVKRIIGLPGDTIAIRHGVGFIINGKRMNFPLTSPNYDWPTLSNGQAYRLPPFEYFVIGDNLNHSWDSHLWLDPITKQPAPGLPLRNIIGRVSFRFWPFDKIGVMRDDNYRT